MLPSIETRPAPEMKSFQEEKLRELLIYLQTSSAFYQDHFRKNDIGISNIKHLEPEDLHQSAARMRPIFERLGADR